MSIKLKHSTGAPDARALIELEIPDAVPIPWNDPTSTLYGVGIAAINNGLVVFVEAYDNMAVGDAVDVYWDSSQLPPISTVSVEAANLNQRLGLRLPEADFRSGDFEPFFRVRRVSGATSDSPARAIRVKLDRPGGPNPDPSTPHNENLVAPQVDNTILQNGVDASQAAQGVDVTIASYPNMAEYDRIDFSWGGQRLIHTVQAAEVGQPIVIHVDESIILAAGDGRVLLMYQVIDVVANRSDGWSQVTQIDVFASGSVLDAPILESINDNTVDLDALAGDDVAVLLLATSPNFAVGDIVEFTWAGRTTANVSVDWTSSLTLTSIPSLVRFIVPNATVVAIAGGYSVMSYTLRKSSGAQLVSKRQQVQVTGTAQLLAAPTVREAVGGVLAADVTQATVEVTPYPGMAPGDLVTLVWAGTRANGEPTVYHDELTVSGGTVGQPLTFVVPGAAQVASLNGGYVQVYYQVASASAAQRALVQESERLLLSVGQAVAVLPAPTVRETEGGVLAPDAPRATVEIEPYNGMAAGDRIDLLWVGNVSGAYTDWLPVSSATVGHTLTFQVQAAQIAPNSGANVSYTVTRAAGGTDASTVLQLRIGEAAMLPAPTIDEAQGDQLSPADVPNGATVRVSAVANLQAGDLVTVRWSGAPGAGSAEFEQAVSGGGSGQALTVSVPLSVVEANEGSSITIDYVIERVGGGTDTSPVAVYDVTSHQTGTGNLLVMGARSYSSYASVSRRNIDSYLAAVNAETLELVDAVWQYENNPAAMGAQRIRDISPIQLLEVTNNSGRVILNSANLCGNVGAMVARLDNGSVVSWGVASYGGTLPSEIADLTDIVAVTPGYTAFVALRANGAVVAWGDKAHGGSVPPGIAGLTDIVAVTGSERVFVALRANGAVVAWAENFATVPPGIAALTDIVAVTGSGSYLGSDNVFAFRVVNGNVWWWREGYPPSLIFRDCVEVIAGNEGRFAARLANGGVTAYPTVPPLDIKELTDIVAVTGNGHNAFAALRANGAVVAWGDAGYGGSVPSGTAELTDIVAVTGGGRAFAALRANGAVVAWGDAGYGGSVPSGIAELTDIVAVTGNGYAFAALRADQTVVTWGAPGYGGDSSQAQLSLVNVRAVYAGERVFAALRWDQRVVTWGDGPSGGDLSGVSDLLNGRISYEATPASRGIGRNRGFPPTQE
uniref:RCC1 domain-containing protein n=1 Tax=Yersinia frederiksenii TaxID=29484 RepID=UPI001F4C25CE|nr:hypothetical protein [Yersinia frederiksenii]ULG19798.1 hypothetical protein 49p1_00080 [Yersinia frederiksenii]